jgi:hypothetical protein
MRRDAKTSEEFWRFYTVPGPGEFWHRRRL